MAQAIPQGTNSRLWGFLTHIVTIGILAPKRGLVGGTVHAGPAIIPRPCSVTAYSARARVG